MLMGFRNIYSTIVAITKPFMIEPTCQGRKGGKPKMFCLYENNKTCYEISVRVVVVAKLKTAIVILWQNHFTRTNLFFLPLETRKKYSSLLISLKAHKHAKAANFFINAIMKYFKVYCFLANSNYIALWGLTWDILNGLVIESKIMK